MGKDKRHRLIVAHGLTEIATYSSVGVGNLLPSASTCPWPVPAIPVLTNINDAPGSIRAHIDDACLAETILIQCTRSITLDNNIGFHNQCTKLLPVCFVVYIDTAIPFSPVQIKVQRDNIWKIWRGASHDAGTQLG